jgi:phospholipase/carboxylesterase
LALLCGTLPFSAGLPTSPGRLDDLPVFVAQGEQDQVIPRELLDRTWEYVRNSSGASVTARRDPVGHELAPKAVAALNSWLRDQLPSAQPAATSGSVNVFGHDIRRGDS